MNTFEIHGIRYGEFEVSFMPCIEKQGQLIKIERGQK